jgi:hypothetical protein
MFLSLGCWIQDVASKTPIIKFPVSGINLSRDEVPVSINAWHATNPKQVSSGPQTKGIMYKQNYIVHKYALILINSVLSERAIHLEL